jgi:hypothetical protein
VLFSFGDKIEVRLAGTNLNNELGLTEGNSRLTTGNVGPINARPLFGRTWKRPCCTASKPSLSSLGKAQLALPFLFFWPNLQ